jgi:lipopolysaccharide biosynthesis regulator YciM
MDIEYWWLLALPLFFALGWLAARIDIKQLLSESRALPTSYFKGLNFLLNEQPDKAIEAFIEVVKVDPQTIELHFALGSLFRRRGEVERAIRMHQNLVERADREEDKRLQAVFELAQDYLKAGLLDRAEELFTKLEDTAHAEAALKFLLEIYQQERTGRKRSALPPSWRPSPGSRTRRRSRIFIVSSRAMRSYTRGRTQCARILPRRWRIIACPCAPTCCSATSR